MTRCPSVVGHPALGSVWRRVGSSVPGRHRPTQDRRRPTRRRSRNRPAPGPDARYNRAQPTRRLAGRVPAPAAKPRSPPRWPTPPHPPTDRPPRRREALHLRLGRGHRRRQRQDEGPPRRQGRGPRRDDARGPADAARIHDHDRGLQRLLRQRQAAAGRPLGRRPRGDQGGRGAVRQGLRRRGQPAPRLGPLGRQVLDARDDGHGPQPRPQRGDPRRA